MSSEHDIENVMYRYGEYVDLARFDELGELFRHGAIRSDRGSGDLRGEAVATFYRATNRVHPDTGTLRTRHIASNVIIGGARAAGSAGDPPIGGPCGHSSRGTSTGPGYASR